MAAKKKRKEFVPCRTNDELTVALGKHDHGGRLRGVGSHATAKELFGLPPRTSQSSRFDFNSPEFAAAVRRQLELNHFQSSAASVPSQPPGLIAPTIYPSTSEDLLVGMEVILV